MATTNARYNHISDSQRKWNERIQPLLGMTINYQGDTWIISGVNDVGYPYFRTLRGRKLYVVNGLNQTWLKTILQSLKLKAAQA